MKKILSVLIISLFLISFLGVSTSAEGNISVPYYTYEYNNFDEAVEAPAGYYPSHILDSSRLSLDKSFKEITDLTYYNGLIYILDSQNGRIVSLDENYNFVKEYSNIRVGDRDRDRLIEIIGGETVNFIGATGLAISKSGKFYIADKLNNRILCVNQDFILESVIVRPDEALNDTDAAFSPSKIAVDDKNRLYVISSDIALGIMIFNANGEFMQFFGANEVLSTTQAFVKAFRKLFMSVAQLELVEQATPVTIRNMDFSNDGFIYTVSPYRESSKSATPGLLKKLNYKGEDVLNASVFGDLEEDNGDKTRFADIDIDNKGFINLLDENRGRVFQYTDSGMLITIFGSKGDQVGCLTTPVAIESVNEDILVDKDINLYFDNDILYYKKSGNGVSARRDAAKAPSGDTAKIYDYSMVTFLQNTKVEPSYLLSLRELEKCVNKYVRKISKIDLECISFSTLGNTLYSDFKARSGIYRAKSVLILQNQLKELSQKYKVALSNSNAYAIPFADQIFDAPMASSGYDIFAYDVPFYQMVVNGYSSYTTSAIIQSVDYDAMILKAIETGSDLLFDCVYTDSADLTDTALSGSYSSQYESWKEKAIKSYKEIEDINIKLNGSNIKGHSRIASDVYCTVYENGIKIIVNYNGDEITVDGITVKGKNYAVVEA